MADPRILAERFNHQIRGLVLMLRRAGAGQPVTSQQLAVLSSLEAGPRRMSDLAADHGVRLPTMTRQIDRLVRDGLATRGQDADDARVVAVGLTSAGERALREGRDRRIAFLAERLQALSEPERAAIEAALPALEKLFADY